jgi:uncharacterized protein DUF5675
VNLTLTRFLVEHGSTFGRLTGLSKKLYVAEEWRDNKSNFSCIPPGTYQVVPHGWNGEPVKFTHTWRLLSVPGRSGILIHEDNTHSDTQGCLLVGMGMMTGQLSTQVNDSRLAMRFLRQEIGPRGFTLTIQP